jgi:2,4-dienoyl-CoA reductase-like NADH-dependent reductase (Old Yellow Enzyme family)
MEALEKLFGGAAIVKILRLFLMNPEEIIEKKGVQKRAKVTVADATRELKMLEDIGLIKQKSFFKDKKYKNGKTKKVREKGYIVDSSNKLFVPLQSLLIKNSPMSSNSMIKKLSRNGKISLVVVSGFFIQNPDSRVDLLVVGDSIKSTPMKKTISTMESEIGKQIRYAIFETEDFKYRLGVYDRLVRDILDYPHEVVLDKIGL